MQSDQERSFQQQTKINYQRQCHYLNAMGFSLWQTRRRLPFARTIPTWLNSQLFPTIIKKSTQLPTIEVKSFQSDNSTVLRQSILSPTIVDKVSTKAGSPAFEAIVPAHSSTITNTVSLQFSFALITNITALTIICTPHSPVNQSEKLLLAAILKALGYKDFAPTWLPFHWPLVTNATTVDPLSEARAGISAFMAAQHRTASTTNALLIFGLTENDQSHPLLQVFQIENQYTSLLAMPALMAPGLSELNGDLLAKRTLWEGIKKIQYG